MCRMEAQWTYMVPPQPPGGATDKMAQVAPPYHLQQPITYQTLTSGGLTQLQSPIPIQVQSQVGSGQDVLICSSTADITATSAQCITAVPVPGLTASISGLHTAPLIQIPLPPPPPANRAEDVEKKVRKKPKKRSRNEELWKKNVRKKFRNEGKAYLGHKNKVKPPRQVKEGCALDCRYGCRRRIKEEERQKIFDSYWGSGDINRQRLFLATNVFEEKKKSEKVPNSKRGRTLKWTLMANNFRYTVCQTFFLHTLDITPKVVYTALKKRNAGAKCGPDLRGYHSNHPKKIDDSLKFKVCKHIDSFPRIDKSFCVKGHKTEYLEAGLNVKKLYRNYTEVCFIEGCQPVKMYVYREIFKKEFAISFGKPSEDICVRCENIKREEERESSENKAEDMIASAVRNVTAPQPSTSNPSNQPPQTQPAPKKIWQWGLDNLFGQDFLPPPHVESQGDALGSHDPSDGNADVMQGNGAVISDNEYLNFTKKGRPKKRQRNPDNWKSVVRKNCRNMGMSYIGHGNKVKEARKVKEGCAKECRARCHEKIPPEQRQEIFRRYWSTGDVTKQRDFIVTYVHEMEKKTQKVDDSKRTRSLQWTLPDEVGDEYIVCKTFFLATLDITGKVVQTALKKKYAVGLIEPDKRGKHTQKKSKICQTSKNFVRRHIESFPTHYPADGNGKEFREPGLNVKKMYDMYLEECYRSNEPPVKISTYRQIFKDEYSINFQKVAKDGMELTTQMQQPQPQMSHQQQQQPAQLEPDMTGKIHRPQSSNHKQPQAREQEVIVHGAERYVFPDRLDMRGAEHMERPPPNMVERPLVDRNNPGGMMNNYSREREKTMEFAAAFGLQQVLATAPPGGDSFLGQCFSNAPPAHMGAPPAHMNPHTSTHLSATPVHLSLPHGHLHTPPPPTHPPPPHHMGLHMNHQFSTINHEHGLH